MRIHRRIPALIGVGTACLALGACGSSQSTSSGSTNATTAASNSAATTSLNNNYTLGYIGGTAGPADASKSPVYMGWVNEQGGTVSFPGYTQAAEMAVKYVNTELGGVQGHPVRLVTCYVLTAVDGTSCGAKMAGNPNIDILGTGALIDGGQQLYSVVGGQKPVEVSAAVSAADGKSKNVFSASSGGLQVVGMAVYAAQGLHAKHVAVLYSSDPVGVAQYNAALKPVLAKLGVSETGVPISNQVTGPDVQQALLAAGASSADAIIVFMPPQACGPVDSGLRLAGITKPVLAPSASCATTAVTQYLKQQGIGGDAPDGWYFASFANDPHIPSGPAYNSYLAAIKQFDPTLNNPLQSLTAYGTVMTIVKFMNQVGYAQLSPTALHNAIVAYKGEEMLQGPVSCPPQGGVCGHYVGVIQYTNGKWVTKRWGATLINASQY